MNTATVDTGISVDYGKSLKDMIAAGKYDWVNPNITAGRFPVEGQGVVRLEPKLFHFGRYISSEDAVSAMKSEGFMPGGHVHGLSYGAAFPKEQLKYPIVCLGSVARVGGDRCVVCLSGDGGRRFLYLGGWDGGWHDYWRFLGVRTLTSAS
jgi:hypothetical protein